MMRKGLVACVLALSVATAAVAQEYKGGGIVGVIVCCLADIDSSKLGNYTLFQPKGSSTWTFNQTMDVTWTCDAGATESCCQACFVALRYKCGCTPATSKNCGQYLGENCVFSDVGMCGYIHTTTFHFDWTKIPANCNYKVVYQTGPLRPSVGLNCSRTPTVIVASDLFGTRY